MARSMTAISKKIDAATKEIVKDALDVSRQEMKTTAAGPTGGDGRFSGFGPAGRLRVKGKYDPGGVTILPVGVWKVAEEGVDPHMQPRRKFKHPGTKQGRKSWTRGRDAALTRLDKSIPATLDKAVEEGFRA